MELCESKVDLASNYNDNLKQKVGNTDQHKVVFGQSGGGVLSGGKNLSAETTDRRNKGKYPLDREKTIQFGKRCFSEQGREYTELDAQFTSVMVDLVNDAYAQGFADGRSAMPPKGGVAV